MVVGANGWLAGTTGGGTAEARIIAQAVDLLHAADPTACLVTQTHRAGSAQASGMVCGGEQAVALVPGGLEWGAPLGRLDSVLAAGGSLAWTISPRAWTLGRAGVDGFSTDAQGWAFTHVSGPSHRVVVVGAGHVGSALARVLVPLGFRVGVVDERRGAAARLASQAHETAECPYEELRTAIASGERTFVAIATHASDRDAAAVAALAGLTLGYLGILGSRAKIAHLPDPPELLVAPMGMAIGSHTPEEIAVSIAAQLIAARACTVQVTPVRG
jgi:xanthine dehydrogenase accessory factor